LTCDAAHVCVAHGHHAAATAPWGLVVAISFALVILPVALFWGAAILSTKETS